LSEVWNLGGEGALELAKEVSRLAESGVSGFKFIYPDELSISEKIEAIASNVYGADGVDFTPQAKSQIDKISSMGYSRLLVCMAKTQYSFSDSPALLGWTKGFRISVRSVKVSAGAGFAAALASEIMTMPGLPTSPAAERIDVDGSSKISCLF
jgi:formate--tetrahydrofolate ligase